MNDQQQIIDLIKQMQIKFPYLKDLGYGLTFPACIYLQKQLEKLNIKADILSGLLHPKSVLRYHLAENLEKYRNSPNKHNKTFYKFSNVKIDPQNTTRKIYYCVIKVGEELYDPTNNLFNLPLTYNLKTFTSNFYNIRIIRNTKFSDIDLDDMLSDRVPLITEILNSIYFV